MIGGHSTTKPTPGATLISMIQLKNSTSLPLQVNELKNFFIHSSLFGSAEI